MKNILKLLFFAGIIVLAAFSCDDEKDNPSDYKPIEIKKITDFGCEDCVIRIKTEYMEDDTSYIIYSESDFNKYVEYYAGTTIPAIDYQKYFLIIGMKRYLHGAEIIEEKAKENNEEIIYTITLLINDYHTPITLFYHVFLEKPIDEKNIRIELIY